MYLSPAKNLDDTKEAFEQLKFIVFEEGSPLCGLRCVVKAEQNIVTDCKMDVSCSKETTHVFSQSTGPLQHHMPPLNSMLLLCLEACTRAKSVACFIH